MEIGIKVILVLTLITYFRWSQCDSSTCFIETLVVIKSVQWLLHVPGYIIGEKREKLLRKLIRRGDLVVWNFLVKMKDNMMAVISWCIRRIRGGNPHREFIFIFILKSK